jgi:phage shock protein C
MLGGVCGGLGEYFNIDPTVVRLVFVLLAFVTAFFPAFLLYFILWIIVPRNPASV